MSRISVSLLALGLSTVVAVLPASAQTTLTLSGWLPPSHLLTRAMVDWAADVEKASEGRIKYRLLPKAVVAPPGTIDAVQDGLADVSYIVHGYTPGRFVATGVAEVPLLGDSAETMAVAYQRIHERYLAAADEHKGVKVLTVFTHGAPGIFTIKKPVRNAADLEGLKMRMGGGMVAELAKSFGINTLLKPASEAYELLSTGVADGTLSGIEGIGSFKLEKVIRYWTRVPGGLYNITFSMIMHPATYNKLSAADKAAIDSVSGEKLARRVGKYWDEADRASIAAMAAANVEVIDVDKAFVETLRQKAVPLEAGLFKAMQAKGIDGEQALKALRAEIKKVEAGQ